MADTYLSLRVHLVWATKNRRPWLDPEWRSRLFACALAVVARRGGKLLCAGGSGITSISISSRPARWPSPSLVTSIKTTTCKWIHETFAHRRDFRWQHGYGAFSVTPSTTATSATTSATRRSITGNERFTNEYTSLLLRHGVIFDPAHVTD